MKKISSKDNSKLKLIKSLSKKKYRDQSGKFLVESVKFIADAINLDADIDFVVFDERNTDKNLLILLEEKDIETYSIEAKVFSNICDTISTQGAIAVASKRMFKYSSDDRLIVFLDDLQDPGNLGTIIRTSLAFGIDKLFLSKNTVDAYNPKTTRATAAAIFKQAIIRVDDKMEFFNEIKRDGFEIISTVVDSDVELGQINLNDKICLVIGSEGNGVSKEVKAFSDHRVTIKMSGDQESLNASIAAGIVIYEASKLKTS